MAPPAFLVPSAPSMLSDGDDGATEMGSESEDKDDDEDEEAEEASLAAGPPPCLGITPTPCATRASTEWRVSIWTYCCLISSAFDWSSLPCVASFASSSRTRASPCVTRACSSLFCSSIITTCCFRFLSASLRLRRERSAASRFLRRRSSFFRFCSAFRAASAESGGPAGGDGADEDGAPTHPG